MTDQSSARRPKMTIGQMIHRSDALIMAAEHVRSCVEDGFPMHDEDGQTQYKRVESSLRAQARRWIRKATALFEESKGKQATNIANDPSPNGPELPKYSQKTFRM